MGRIENTAPITRRLLRIFDSATDVQRTSGIEWYREAHDISVELAGDDFTVAQAAGVIAVLSPNTSWKGNITNARKAFACYRAGVPVNECRAGLGANVRKAYRILDGDMSAITGPKVTAFFQNIMGDPLSVTIDLWATRAAIGEDIPGRLRATVERAYLNAAKKRNVSPRDFQAVVWVSVRESQLALF